MNKSKSFRYAVALAAACQGLLQSQAQTALPAAWALPNSAAAASSPGFNVRVAQANTGSGDLANSNARTELQLAGLIIDPKTGVAYTNDIDTTAFTFDANGIYTEPVTIAYEKGGGGANGLIPGIPGIEVQTDNIALEATTWLKLAVGTYTMVVNSDDGFQVSAGPDARDVLNSVVLGAYDGGRGTGDTAFKFTVSQAGLYSFRLTYEQGGGGANVSWFSADNTDPTTGQVLINDAGGLQAFRKVTSPVVPYVSFAAPGKGATAVSPSAPITLKITDGSPRKADTASVKLSIDGTVVPAAVTRAGNTTTVTFTPSVLADPLSVHAARLVYGDDGAPSTLKTNDWTFTISKYSNLKLPAPLFFEDFESTAEGEIPTGWTRVNFTTGSTGSFDLLDPNSDTYLDWVVISRDTVLANTHWDSGIRLQAGENYVNGARVTDLVQGKFCYAESDNRGGSQVQYLFTKDYDLTGKTSIYVAFNSIYEQNQDSIGATEYSVDGGTTWLPIAYFLDGPDIVHDAQGNVDAVATFTADNGDTASLTDPVSGEEIGHKYGAFIGAHIDASLAPFIQARVNDDPIESKRVEFYPLPAAANQKKVRFRFAQAGTGSWYFGIDNLGIYSITVVDAPKINIDPVASTSAFVGLAFTLKVDASGIGLGYQWKKDGNPIQNANGATFSVAKSALTDGGDYTVEITNAGGKATSKIAHVSVTAPPTSIAVNDNLDVHLKFDGDYKDASVNHADGSAVGAPTFENALFGKGVRIKTLKDGSVNNYVTLGYPASLKFSDTTAFTVSFWVTQNDQADDQPYFSNKNWASSNNRGWGIFSQGGNAYRVNLTGPGAGSDKFSKTPSGQVGNGSWHNLIVTVVRGGSVNTYVDGNLDSSNPITTAGNINTDDIPLAFNIGQDGTGVYTDGGSAQIEFVMDDFAVWSRALSAGDVAAIALGGAAGKSLDDLGVVDVPAKLSATLGTGNVNVTWTGTGFTLEGSSTLTGTYGAVAGAGANSATVPTTGTQLFLRLKK